MFVIKLSFMLLLFVLATLVTCCRKLFSVSRRRAGFYTLESDELDEVDVMKLLVLTLYRVLRQHIACHHDIKTVQTLEGLTLMKNANGTLMTLTSKEEKIMTKIKLFVKFVTEGHTC